tara:strand:+ start:130 stop:765 length:636 start_codon:yes stop_codon:yes gene_type:complete
MAYGDITNSPNAYRSPSKPGVQTVRKAVLLKDSGSTIGSLGVNYLNDTKTLEQLTSSGTASTTDTKAILHKNAGIYVGTAGNIMVNFSGDKDAIETGTATGTAVTNKLVDTNTDSPKKFTKTVQLRDLVVNTTDGTVAFVGAIDSDTQLNLVNVANVQGGSPASDIMAENETYEIYRPIVFQNVAAGSFLPIEVERVFDTGTTADDIMAIY